MVIDNHDCSCGSGCSRVGQFHQHAQPNWVDHCSCMPRGSGDLLHRQQADFLNMPRSSARRDSTFQQPGPARPVCFTVIDVLSSRCAAAPLPPAPLRCCAAPPLHPVWISCPRRGISFLWRRTPSGSLPARDFCVSDFAISTTHPLSFLSCIFFTSSSSDKLSRVAFFGTLRFARLRCLPST